MIKEMEEQHLDNYTKMIDTRMNIHIPPKEGIEDPSKMIEPRRMVEEDRSTGETIGNHIMGIIGTNPRMTRGIIEDIHKTIGNRGGHMITETTEDQHMTIKAQEEEALVKITDTKKEEDHNRETIDTMNVARYLHTTIMLH